jgi:hypothetical protein
MVASTVAGLAFALSAVALMGFRFSTQTTFSQLQTRLSNHSALDKMGRQIMQSTQVQVEGDGETDPQILHLWHDDQVVWTPQTTEDDTEALLYLDVDSQELRYRPDKNNDAVYEVVSRGIEGVKFTLTGNALFIEMTMSYDPHTVGAERKLLASFVVRNNPKSRVGSSN